MLIKLLESKLERAAISNQNIHKFFLGVGISVQVAIDISTLHTQTQTHNSNILGRAPTPWQGEWQQAPGTSATPGSASPPVLVLHQTYCQKPTKPENHKVHKFSNATSTHTNLVVIATDQSETILWEYAHAQTKPCIVLALHLHMARIWEPTHSGVRVAKVKRALKEDTQSILSVKSPKNY